MRTPNCKHIEGVQCSLCRNNSAPRSTTGGMFDALESVSQKQEGIQQAADGKDSLLSIAREIAIEIAKKNGTVHADDVGKEMAVRKLQSLGPAAGHVFRNDAFVWTGEWHESTRVTNHARMLRVWRLA